MLILAILMLIAGLFAALMCGDGEVRETLALFIKLRFLPNIMPNDLWLVPLTLIAASLLIIREYL